ncbi:MAG TPA: ribose ABC transporter permease [Steroidobacteraceae bacterium]|jgi:ribose transport system permease protein|nr:ribose ABC transporter permease [Steroidobacteraceae bacterium]
MSMTAQHKAALQRLGPLLALVAVCIALAFMSPDFLTVSNSFDVMRQVSINAVIAFGMTLSILLGGIDLSVGSILAVSSVLAAMMMTGGHGAVLAVAVAILAGAAMGSLNGVVIAKGKVAPFIATLGMMTLLRGLALVFANGSPISGFSSNFFATLGDGYVARLIPVPVVLMLVMFAVFWFVLGRTVFGRHVYATGGNAEAAKLSGVNIDRVQILVYTVSGAMAALAGVILTSRLDSAQPTAGAGYELDAITAVVLGGTSLAGGRGWIFGTLVGALLIGVLNNGLNLMGVSAFYQQVVKGSVILLAVLLDRGGKS